MEYIQKKRCDLCSLRISNLVEEDEKLKDHRVDIRAEQCETQYHQQCHRLGSLSCDGRQNILLGQKT